jgi:hypothetical protein
MLSSAAGAVAAGGAAEASEAEVVGSRGSE